MPRESPWRTFPRSNIIIFLAAVFFVFASFGFASDSMDMGRQPPLRFALLVVISGLLPAGYAATGILLRRKAWMGFLPMFAAHFCLMWFLAHRLPVPPRPAEYAAGAAAYLGHRLNFDGLAIVVCVSLGYIGFLTVSIREGRRYARLQGEKAALDSEMAAARDIQRAMVPEDLPPTPGYTIESIYRPAAQVGGDFYQVIPVKSGGSLVVLGDVSGKGLSAAMLVSMLVGILRTLAGLTEEPAEILGELNRRAFGRTHGSFVTCVVIRLDPGGRLTVANAGHLSPYLNGMELPFAGSLPLGMAGAAEYEQSALQVHGGDRLVLLTDGIVEAQNERGELLGFGQVEKLVRAGTAAREVADAAQQHGQADDMTVISIECDADATIHRDEVGLARLPDAS